MSTRQCYEPLSLPASSPWAARALPLAGLACGREGRPGLLGVVAAQAGSLVEVGERPRKLVLTRRPLLLDDEQVL